MVKRATEDSAGGRWVLSIGPTVDAKGLSPNNTVVDGYGWTGWPLRISVKSALKAEKAIVEIYDNTSNTLLNKTILTLNDGGFYTYASYDWMIPFDQSLKNHRLIIISTFAGEDGSRVSGPVYDSITVNEAPQPIPENASYVVGGVLAALMLVFILMRWRAVFS